MAKYLDKTGLEYFWGKLKIYLNNKYQAKGDYATNTALNNEIQTIYDGPIVYLQEDIDALNTKLQEVRTIAENASDLCNDMNADVAALYNTKQDNLVSGTNIKTINGQNILGSGDITIEGSSGGSNSWVKVTESFIHDSTTPLYVKIENIPGEGDFIKIANTDMGDEYGVFVVNENSDGNGIYIIIGSVTEDGLDEIHFTHNLTSVEGDIYTFSLLSVADGQITYTPITTNNAYFVVNGSGGSNINVDTEMSSTSTNPVQNKVIYNEIQAIYDGPIAYLQEDIDAANTTIENRYTELTQGFDFLQNQIEANNKFKILNRVTLEVNNYTDISSYMSNYNELMIIVRVVPNASSTIGIANNISGSTGFLASLATSATTYFKITMNKTDEGYYAWTITSSSGNLSTFGWTSSTGYKYIRNYSSSATSISMSVVIHGR